MQAEADTLAAVERKHDKELAMAQQQLERRAQISLGASLLLLPEHILCPTQDVLYIHPGAGV